MQGRPPLTSRPPRALYVHLPFCARQCPYCDFATARLNAADEARYLEALAAEARDRLPPGWSPRTVFLGGGTPGELTTAGLARLIEVLAPLTVAATEVTVEANPRTLLRRKLHALMEGLRVGRLSLGAQSFDARLLTRLGRFHRPQDVAAAVALARESGVRSVSLDLMFAVPGQTLAQLDADLDAALALRPDHISTYCLTVESGTVYGAREADGRLRLPGQGRQAAYFARVRRRLRAAGFSHYEVSNFALPGRRCRHNQVYWRNQAYIGLGNGAASHVDGVRTTNHRDVSAYVQAVERGGGQAAVAEREALEPARKARETAYLLLRTSEGIVPARFQRETGFDPRALFGEELVRLSALGLIEERAGRIRLTGRGVSLADAVGRELL